MALHPPEWLALRAWKFLGWEQKLAHWKAKVQQRCFRNKNWLTGKQRCSKDVLETKSGLLESKGVLEG